MISAALYRIRAYHALREATTTVRSHTRTSSEGKKFNVRQHEREIDIKVTTDNWRGKSYRMIVNREYQRIVNKFPVLADILDKHPVKIRIGDKKIGMEDFGGLYEDDKISLYVPKEIGFAVQKLSIGEYLTDPSPEGTFRHELGHHVVRVLGAGNSSDGPFMTAVFEQMKLEGLDPSRTVDRKKWITANISKYGALNIEEAFAEAFTAYTHKLHGKKVALHKSIRNVFDDLLNKKKLQESVHPRLLAEAKVRVKAHVRHSEKGKAYRVKQHEREIITDLVGTLPDGEFITTYDTAHELGKKLPDLWDKEGRKETIRYLANNIERGKETIKGDDGKKKLKEEGKDILITLRRISDKETVHLRGDLRYDHTEMANAVKAGKELPPIQIGKSEQGLHLLDGHHRWRAYKAAGVDPLVMVVEVIPGVKGKPRAHLKIDLPLKEAHLRLLAEATTTVKAHVRHSEKGKAFTVQQHEREVDDSTPTEAEMSFRRDWVEQTKKDLDAEHIPVDVGGEGYDFQVGDAKYKAAGQFDPVTGRITLYNGAFKAGPTHILAHEVQHFRFATWQRLKTDENAKIDALNKILHWRDPNFPMRASGAIKPQFQDEYRALHIYHRYFETKDFAKIESLDGITSYSADYWKKYGSVKHKSGSIVWFWRAVDETLAEVAYVHSQARRYRGSLAGKEYADKYSKVNRYWRGLYENLIRLEKANRGKVKFAVKEATDPIAETIYIDANRRIVSGPSKAVLVKLVYESGKIVFLVRDKNLKESVHPRLLAEAKARVRAHTKHNKKTGKSWVTRQHEREILSRYVTGGSYLAINSLLRAGKSHPDVKTLDAVIDRNKTTTNMTVYRAISGATVGLKVGDVATDKGYYTASKDKSTAINFSPLRHGAIELKVPKGTNYVSLVPFQKEAYREAGLLLKRNLKIKITGERYEQHKKYGKVRILTAELTEDNKAPITEHVHCRLLAEAKVRVKAHLRKNKKTGKVAQVDQHERSVDDKVDVALNDPTILKHLKPPAIMYHVTDASRIESIKRNGLKQGTRSSTEGQVRGVYLTPDPNDFEKEGVDIELKDPVVLEISTKGLSLRLDPEYYSFDAIDKKSLLDYVRGVNAGEEMYALYSKKPVPARAIRFSVKEDVADHSRMLAETQVRVKAHTRHSNKGKAFQVRQHEREITKAAAGMKIIGATPNEEKHLRAWMSEHDEKVIKAVPYVAVLDKKDFAAAMKNAAGLSGYKADGSEVGWYDEDNASIVLNRSALNEDGDFEEDPDTLGEWKSTFDHELGHAAYYHSSKYTDWVKRASDKTFDRFTWYAKQEDVHEAFAESYMAYIKKQGKANGARYKDVFKEVANVISGVTGRNWWKAEREKRSKERERNR